MPPKQNGTLVAIPVFIRRIGNHANYDSSTDLIWAVGSEYEHRKHSKWAGTGLGTVIIRIWHLGQCGRAAGADSGY
jgi:hypothetical protein